MIPDEITTRPWHLVRYGTPAEAQYLCDYAASFDATVFNANMVAHAPRAVALFVGERGVKPFLIDPLTHAFQHDPAVLMNKDGNLKKSIRKLADQYGSLVSDRAGITPINPKDLSQAAIEEMCDAVMLFQRETIVKRLEEEGLTDYLEFAEVGAIARPMVLVAPYFFMGAQTWREWLGLNISFADCAADRTDGEPLYLELVIDQAVLADDAATTTIASAYAGASADGVLVWIDSFSEHDVSPAALLRFMSLVRTIHSSGKRVVNLHGGYFSVSLLGPAGGSILGGVCHGMEYGEDRAVVPVGGGIPMARYYYPDLHRRLRYADVLRLATRRGYLADSRAFHEHVCDCPVCRSVIDGDTNRFAQFGEGREVSFQRKGQLVTLNYPVTASKDLCLRHYLERKRIEFARHISIDAPDADSEANVLRAVVDKYTEDLGLETVAYLLGWAEAIAPRQ